MMMVTAYNNGYYTHDDNLETFGLLWLDVAVNTNEENRRAQQQLRSIINHITTFEDPNLCQEYIQSVCLQDRLILIVSGRFGRELVPRIHHVRQLSSIYVYCKDKQKNQKWAKKFRKVSCFSRYSLLYICFFLKR